MDKEVFDLAVIGGGTAGLRTALYSAGHGHKTVMIEPHILGGTCLNTGCIPTKTLLHSSHLFVQSRELEEFGISISAKANFKKIMQRVHDIVQEGQDHISTSIKNNNLTLIKEKASFISKDTVQAGKRIITASKFILCTGSKPHVPPIKGIDTTPHLVSDDVLALTTLPKSVLIVGGGYIGLELGTFFAELGTEVTVAEVDTKFLRVLDDDVVQLLIELYEKKGLSLLSNTAVLEVSKKGKQVRAQLQNQETKKNKTLEVDHIIVATGRIPNTFGLNLELGMIKTTPRGGIDVNSTLQTSNPNVYAIGDVIGRAPFAHAAKRESHIALENALDGKQTEMNFDLVPWAMFTSPPIAAVGLSENQCKEKNIPYGLLKANYSRAGRARVIGKMDGFVKVLYHKETKKILGSVLIGPHADELVHEMAAFMNCNATTAELANTIHIHPTLSEVFEALKDAS